MWTTGKHSLLRYFDKITAEANVVNMLLGKNAEPQHMTFYRAGVFIYQINGPYYIKKTVYQLLKQSYAKIHLQDLQAFLYGTWGLSREGVIERIVKTQWPEKPEFMNAIILAGSDNELKLEFFDEHGLLWSDVVGEIFIPKKLCGNSIEASDLEDFNIVLDPDITFTAIKKIKRLLRTYLSYLR